MALKESQKSLNEWTAQKWRTKSGKPSTQGSKATGERYLPEKAIKAMSSEDYAASSRKKREDTKQGKQFSKQPKKAATIARNYRYGGGLMSQKDTTMQTGGLGELFNQGMRNKYADGGKITEKDIEHINSFKSEKDREALIGKYQIFAGYEALRKADVDESAEPEKAEKIKKEAAEEVLKDLKSKGVSTEQRVKYNEGSLFVPPEMEAMPEDTYDNIPMEEKAAAEASQLPDAEMLSEYKNYVMSESLEPEEMTYLQDALTADPQLSQVFDKVMNVAVEFSGAGEVEGPGTGVSDSIPARLSDGEFVFTKKATDQLGADQLQSMMDTAEKAYDGGLMSRRSRSMDQPSTGKDLQYEMIQANQMPSVR